MLGIINRDGNKNRPGGSSLAHQEELKQQRIAHICSVEGDTSNKEKHRVIPLN